MMNYKDLNKAIKNKALSPVYLFTGPEHYIGHMMEKTLLSSMVPLGLEPLNSTTYNEKNVDLSELLATCETLPLMSEKRLVVVREEAQIEKITNKTEVDKLVSYLEKPNQSTVLIIYIETPDKRKKIYKAIQKKGQIIKYDKLDQRDLENWLGRRLKLGNKKISKTALETFILRSRYLTNENKNMEMVDHDLNKIMDYSGDRNEITKEDILLIMPESIEDGIYKMVDYAMAGEKGKALAMLNQFYLEGESPFGVFNLLLRQIRQFLMVKIYSSRGLPSKTVASEMKLPPFVVNKILKIGRKYEIKPLWNLMVIGAELDAQMKKGEIDQNFALELFIIKMG